MANRRPIASAFRRPFRFRRGRRPVRWVSEFWGSEEISLNNIDLNSFQLLKSDDWYPVGTLLKNHTVAKRVVMELTPEFCPTLQSTFHRPIGITLMWMLWVVDADDTDLSSIKSGIRGTPLQSARVLQVGTHGFYIQQCPDESVSQNGRIIYVPPIRVDWRGLAKLGPDDLLVFSLSEQHSTAREADGYADSLFTCALSGWSRVLIAKP